MVVTHRTPLIVLPSVCRLFESTSVPNSKDGSFNKHRFAALTEYQWEKCFSVPLKFRQENPQHEAQIFDCLYDEFFADPIAMVKKIYSQFDMEFSDEFEQRMQAYLDNNRQGKHGRHQYSLEEYGLTAAGVYERNKDYMDHYRYSPVD